MSDNPRPITYQSQYTRCSWPDQPPPPPAQPEKPLNPWVGQSMCGIRLMCFSPRTLALAEPAAGGDVIVRLPRPQGPYNPSDGLQLTTANPRPAAVLVQGGRGPHWWQGPGKQPDELLRQRPSFTGAVLAGTLSTQKTNRPVVGWLGLWTFAWVSRPFLFRFFALGVVLLARVAEPSHSPGCCAAGCFWSPTGLGGPALCQPAPQPPRLLREAVVLGCSLPWPCLLGRGTYGALWSCFGTLAGWVCLPAANAADGLSGFGFAPAELSSPERLFPERRVALHLPGSRQ